MWAEYMNMIKAAPWRLGVLVVFKDSEIWCMWTAGIIYTLAESRNAFGVQNRLNLRWKKNITRCMKNFKSIDQNAHFRCV